MDYDPDNPLPSLEHQAFENYFNVEVESMAAEGYETSNQVTLRYTALNVILENSKCFHFDAFIPYLAMNYFDRFISRHRVPNVLGLVRHDVELAALACLTLAWKMRDETFRFRFFMADKPLRDDYKDNILEMELHILNGLNWRMRAVTAICFSLFFAENIPVGKFIKRRSLNEIIIQSQGDIRFTQFRPSVIAASALLTACKFLYPNEYDRCYRDLLAIRRIREEHLKLCLPEIHEMCIKTQINFERNRKFEGRPRPGIETRGTSSSISIKEPRQIISDIEGETESQSKPSSISHSAGKETVQQIPQMKEEPGESETHPSLISSRPGKEPMQKISQIEEEPGEIETDSNLFSSRPGKVPTQEITAMKEEPGECETDPSFFSGRLGKEPMQEISVTKEEPGESKTDTSLFSRRPGKEPMQEMSEMEEPGESENEAGLSFELKWGLWIPDNPMDMIIDSPLFRPPGDRTGGTLSRDYSALVAQPKCCVLM